MTTAHRTRALVLGVALVSVTTFAPVIVVSAIGWQSITPFALLAGLSAVVAALTGGGWRTSAALAVPFAAFAAAASWTHALPLAAALVLAAAAFLRGLAAVVGLHNAIMTSVITLGFIVAQPPTAQGDLPAPLAVALVVLAACLWVTLIAVVTSRWAKAPTLHPLPRPRAIGFAAVLSLMVGLAAWCVARFDLGHAGAWIILTIVVVLQPYLKDGMRKAAERSGGTLLGFGLAVLVGVLTSSPTVLIIVGVACLVLATASMVMGHPYWHYATFLTAAIILFEGADGSVLHTAEERLAATLIAVVATMAVILALTPVMRRLAERAGLDRS